MVHGAPRGTRQALRYLEDHPNLSKRDLSETEFSATEIREAIRYGHSRWRPCVDPLGPTRFT